MTTPYRKKLIEVALPLEAINKASARGKSIRHVHPSTLHLWWARRPLAAARAVIFAQMVDDPSAHPGIFPTEKSHEFTAHDTHRLHYTQSPFQREPHLGAASVNYDFGERLARAEQKW